jgi:hypothetical protein
MTKASDDLAEAHFEHWINGDNAVVSTKETFRTLAREAEAMGAKKALEDAASSDLRNFDEEAGRVERWLRARAEQIDDEAKEAE